MDNQTVLSKLKRSNRYKAKCDFEPKNEDILSAKPGGTLSSPSTPKVGRKNLVAAAVGQLEKCSSEPDVNSQASGKKEANSKSEHHLPSLPREVFLAFKEGDDFEVVSRASKKWWAVRALQGSREVGYVPANYLIEIPRDDDANDNEDLEIPRSEDERALQELHARIRELQPGLHTMIPDPQFPPPMPENVHRDGEGLILPRKPANPCIESGEHKSLHRELLFNQKVGKNVLNQKSELQRAMEKHREQAARKEAEKEKTTNKSAFEKVIEERARRLETLERQEEEERIVDSSQPEFLQVHAKLRARMDSK